MSNEQAVVRVDQIFTDKNGPCEILSAVATPAAPASDSLVISAIAGKRIRVVSIVLVSSAATVGTAVFKSASGGVAKMVGVAPPNTMSAPPYPFNPAGWIETETGQGLYVDVGTTTSFISLRYFAWTP